jgi:membrane protease YdiL (CAAX protease family)
MPDDAPGPAGGRLLDRRAAALVAIAICLGAVVQLIALALSHRHSIEPDALIRYDLVLTLGLYAAVAVMIVSQITPSVRLRWGVGPLVQRVGIGVLVGAGLSGILLAMVSASAGHLRPDPRIVLLMSEGDATHILLTVLIACAAAPVIEETLFRGLLLESLRPIDTGVALVVSAMAFAVWHLTPAALVYYTAMGAVLGWLYIKRGLAASMAAHVGFNGVLTIAAIFVVLGPAHTVKLDGVSFQAPSGWSVQSSVTASNFGAAAVLRGPDDAIVEVIEGPVGQQFDPDAAAARLQSESLPFQSELSLNHSTIREETLPVGRAIEADVTVEGRSGKVVLISAANRPFAVVFLDAGSAKASSDFTKILNSARVD